MARIEGTTRRRIALRGSLVAVVLAVAGRIVAACVLWDPAPDTPPPIHTHPVIEASAVTPPNSLVLTELPPAFTVPLEIIDPTATFLYEVFVDYDPFDQGVSVRPVITAETVDPTTVLADAGVITVQFSLDPSQIDPTVCHVIQFIVALGLNLDDPHTPDAYGADEIEWQYAPAGAVGGCVAFDGGGLDGAFPDGNDAMIVPPVGD